MRRFVRCILGLFLLMSAGGTIVGGYYGDPSGLETTKLVECYIEGEGYPEQRYLCDFRRSNKEIYTLQMQRQGYREAMFRVGSEVIIYVDIPEYRYTMLGMLGAFVVSGIGFLALRKKKVSYENQIQ